MKRSVMNPSVRRGEGVRRLRWAALAAGISMPPAAAIGLAHCDDVSPLHFVAPVLDAEVPDHLDETRIEACRQCITGDAGKCISQYRQCVAMDPRCPRYTECLTASFCWEQFDPNNFGALPPCAAACFQDSGISGLNEILGAAAPGYFCIVSPTGCGPECVDTVDGGAGDAGTE